MRNSIILIFGFIIGVIGIVFLIIYAGWKITFFVFLIVYGNNLCNKYSEKKYDEEEFKKQAEFAAEEYVKGLYQGKYRK